MFVVRLVVLLLTLLLLKEGLSAYECCCCCACCGPYGEDELVAWTPAMEDPGMEVVALDIVKAPCGCFGSVLSRFWCPLSHSPLLSLSRLQSRTAVVE